MPIEQYLGSPVRVDYYRFFSKSKVLSKYKSCLVKDWLKMMVLGESVRQTYPALSIRSISLSLIIEFLLTDKPKGRKFYPIFSFGTHA